MNDRTPTTLERHPWLVLPAVLLAALLTALLRPVPASGEPVVHPAPAIASIVVLPGEDPPVRCTGEVPGGPSPLVVAVDASVRRAIVFATDATSGDVGRSAMALGHVLGRAAVRGERTGHGAPCPVPWSDLAGPAGLLAIAW